MWKMWNFRWILVIVAVVSDGPLSVALRCEPDCNVNKALGCTVRYIGWGCSSTAFPKYQVAPSKPRDLSIMQFSPLNKLTDDVAMNISWRMPVNASSTPLLEGFELTVDVLDVYVSPITQCYHINLTQSLIQDTPQALNEVFFTISCYINRKASDMSARLSSLPHSKNPHLDYVNKNHNVVDMSVRERSVDLCDRDPGVTGTVFLPNPPELHVNLQPSIPPGKYYVRLMQGSYSRDKSVIRIGKNVKRKVVFQNPSILKDGECFGIWVQHENCTTKHYWSPAEPYCINFTAAATTPKPEPSPLPFSESQPSHIVPSGHEGPWLSTTTIIIIVVVVVGILSLGTVAAYLIMKRTAAERYTKVPDVPQNNRVVTEVEDSPITKLLVFYDVFECDTVKSFLKFLEGVKPPSLEIMDFVDENNLFEGSYQWFGTAIEKALHGGGILLIIYSEGLLNLFEAQKRKEYYPKYENNVRHGSLVRKAFDYFQNCIFLSDKEDKVMEHVISLGEYIRDGFFSTRLVKYAGLKRVLVVRDGQTCRLHPGMMSQFLSSLGVSPADIDAALALNSPHSKEFLDTLQRCFRQNTAVTWEEKYGPAEPMKEESNSSLTDSTSLASDSENSSYKGSDSPLSDQWEGKGQQTSSDIEMGNYQLYEKHEDELVNWANMAGQCPADIHVDMPADVEDV